MQTRPAIIGVGAVKAGRYPDRTETNLAMEAVSLALADCGLGQDLVEGLFTTPDLRPSIGLQLNRLCESMRMQGPINTDGGLLSRGHPWAVARFLRNDRRDQATARRDGPEPGPGELRLEVGMPVAIVLD